MIRRFIPFTRPDPSPAGRNDRPQGNGAVYGHVFAPPRPTWAGVWLGVKIFALPALLLILTLDLVVWAIAEALFGACVAVWCAF